LADAAALAARNGIEVHAGHGLTVGNVAPIAAIPQVRELNIGHALIADALFVGLGAAVRAMRDAMEAARG
ncbi:pyridoxine 5'-phosphate synthase, partial [Sphingomonas bacterium]|uniref:pyridoxine 5'-phosphate synthase n=1 Tax=Sphingomonas bacterium TaxID=1895847 RepID=UPI0015772C67